MHAQPHVHSIAVVGMPGWQIALITAEAASFTGCSAVTLDWPRKLDGI